MGYCTAQDLIARFGEEELLRIVPDETGEAIDLAAVALACDDAAGEIDGYAAAAGYPTPLSPVPRIVAAYAADIARYRLYDDAATEQVTKRFNDAIRFLRAVANGDVTLGVKDTAPAGSGGVAQFEGGRKAFGGGGF